VRGRHRDAGECVGDDREQGEQLERAGQQEKRTCHVSMLEGDENPRRRQDPPDEHGEPVGDAHPRSDREASRTQTVAPLRGGPQTARRHAFRRARPQRSQRALAQHGDGDAQREHPGHPFHQCGRRVEHVRAGVENRGEDHGERWDEQPSHATHVARRAHRLCGSDDDKSAEREKDGDVREQRNAEWRVHRPSRQSGDGRREHRAGEQQARQRAMRVAHHLAHHPPVDPGAHVGVPPDGEATPSAAATTP
jgi:hypothetical protein